jgi:hypothetical protein
MPWTVRDIDLDREIINAIEKQEDRSAAILAAIYLEDRPRRSATLTLPTIRCVLLRIDLD